VVQKVHISFKDKLNFPYAPLIEEEKLTTFAVGMLLIC